MKIVHKKQEVEGLYYGRAGTKRMGLIGLMGLMGGSEKKAGC
jgi:hypothetical protein